MATKLDTTKARVMTLVDGWVLKTCEHIETHRAGFNAEDLQHWFVVVGALGSFEAKVAVASRVQGTSEERVREVERVEAQVGILCREIAAFIEEFTPSAVAA